MSKPDTNYISIADVQNKHLTNCRINPKDEGKDCADYDDILKFSKAVHCSIRDSVISGEGLNRENTIDMNRLCSGIVVERCAIISGLQNAITIKGGCEDILIKDCVIEPGNGNCDVDLGNHSDQSQAPVVDVRLDNVSRSDGEPVRVRVINADIPVVTGGNVVVTRPLWGRWPIWNIYSFLRRKGIL